MKQNQTKTLTNWGNTLWEGLNMEKHEGSHLPPQNFIVPLPGHCKPRPNTSLWQYCTASAQHWTKKCALKVGHTQIASAP